MRNNLLIVTIAAVVSLAWIPEQVRAVPTLQMGMQLLDTSNAVIPHSGNVYALSPGQSFRVQVTATLLNPEQSDAFHTDGVTGDPLPVITLGLQNLTFDINSSGGFGPTPFATTAGTIGKWGVGTSNALLALKQAIPASINYPFVNLLDNGSDGDLDPAGAGFNNTLISYEDGTTATWFQNGIGSQINVTRGGYTANGDFVLATNVTAANYYSEGPNQDNVLGARSFSAANIINASVTTVPEPECVGLFAPIALFLLRRCRG